MVQPVHDPYGIDILRNNASIPRESRERLARFIAQHIEKGNEPDYELGRQKLDALNALVEKLEPSTMTDEEQDELVARHTFRRFRR
ncbi:MAG TPA: hypothetical protein VE826_14615 [Dongiaceae bacterium]|nr:hypothetical protein [Dongiaceae bacterium]